MAVGLVGRADGLQACRARHRRTGDFGALVDLVDGQPVAPAEDAIRRGHRLRGVAVAVAVVAVVEGLAVVAGVAWSERRGGSWGHGELRGRGRLGGAEVHHVQACKSRSQNVGNTQEKRALPANVAVA